jgi:adenylate cyclase
MKKSRLPLYTFLAVFLSITIVGAFVVPFLLNTLRHIYLELQADVNYRQAKSMAQFIQKQLDDGRPESEILEDFQASIAGTQFDRGYVCVVDQASTDYLCHPMIQALGTSVANKMALYDDDFDGADLVPWERLIQAGQSGGGLLHYETEQPDEIVYFYSLPEVHWTVSSHENSERIAKEINTLSRVTIVGSLLFALFIAFPISFAVRNVNRRYENQILREQEKSDHLLLNILPASIAERMKNQETMIAEHYAHVSVMFCDIANFTPFSADIGPEKLVSFLNTVFSEFDRISDEFGLEKIKTLGDSYMAVCGVPDRRQDHARPIALAALEMLAAMKNIGANFNVRIGIHSGEVVAGVIGKKKFSYDLWGDTVNTASRLQSHGQEGEIHCSDFTYKLLKEEFDFKDNGLVELKGKGKLHTYALLGPKSNK